MKVKILLLFILPIFITACSEKEVEPWQSADYIHFSKDYQDFYSFVYAGSSVEVDTISVRVEIAGNLRKEDRFFKVEQVKSYGFVYEEDEYGNILDSAFIELPNQALTGVHYVNFKADQRQQFVVSADSLGAYFDLVVLRHPSLKENDHTLTLEVQETSDFSPGHHGSQKVTFTISDNIIEPKEWSDYNVGTKTVLQIMGHYGKIKHQILIDATGQKWNDDFIKKELTEEYLPFYRTLANRELNRINEEREAQGLHKLREDDANPNSEIRFTVF